MNRITAACRVLVLCAAACCVPTQPAHAQHARHVPRQDFHGRDFHHFAPRERAHWRGGHWVQDWHGGRYAWWCDRQQEIFERMVTGNLFREHQHDDAEEEDESDDEQEISTSDSS